MRQETREQETGDKRTRDGRSVMRDSRHETGDKRTRDGRRVMRDSRHETRDCMERLGVVRHFGTSCLLQYNYILVVVGNIKKIPGTVQNFFVFASWMLLKRLISHNIAKLL